MDPRIMAQLWSRTRPFIHPEVESAARSMGSVAAAAAVPEVVFRSKLPDIEIPSHLTMQAYCFERLPEVASRPCLIDGQSGAVYNYAEVEELSRRAAAGLRWLGVGKGDVVMNLLRNCPEFAFTFLGVALLGAVTTTANPFYTPHEIHRQVVAAAGGGVFHLARRPGAAAPACPGGDSTTGEGHRS